MDAAFPDHVSQLFLVPVISLLYFSLCYVWFPSPVINVVMLWCSPASVPQ